jgi:hypothetical protein
MVVTGEAVEIGGTWEVVAEVIAKAEGADAMVDAEGNAWAFSWAGGRLFHITEPAGRWLKIAYGTLAAPTLGGAAPVFTTSIPLAAA